MKCEGCLLGECHLCRDERGRFWFFPWCWAAVNGSTDACTCPSRQPKRLPKWQQELERRSAIERVAQTSRMLMQMLAHSEAVLARPMCEYRSQEHTARYLKNTARYLKFEVPHGGR